MEEMERDCNKLPMNFTTKLEEESVTLPYRSFQNVLIFMWLKRSVEVEE
jgi:hypothetical protein